MKKLICFTGGLALCMAVLTTPTRAEKAEGGFLDFGKLTPSSSGGEFVEINVKSNLIAMVARLLEKTEPQVAEVLRGLHLIRANIVSLREDNRDEVQARVREIRSQLNQSGWEPVVTVQQKKEDVSILVKTRGETAIEGVVVTILDSNHQAILINVVGDIQPDKLALVGEHLHIAPLKSLHTGTKH